MDGTADEPEAIIIANYQWRAVFMGMASGVIIIAIAAAIFRHFDQRLSAKPADQLRLTSRKSPAFLIPSIASKNSGLVSSRRPGDAGPNV